MGRSGPRVAAAAFAALLIALGFAPGFALGERAQDGNLIVSLNGGVDPLVLPRHQAVPAGVRLQGEIGTVDGSPLPRLDQVRIDLAGSGHLFTHGLPKCPGARLRNADSHQAMYRCGDAVVGGGSFEVSIFIPEQSPFTLHGRLLAFNGRARDDRPAIWVHAFSYEPPISLSVPFLIEPGADGYRTALVASLPEWVGPYPHLASFELNLSREFDYRGKRRSYIKASCPVPRPFTAGFLNFARATYSFEDERQLDVESVRSCRAG
jgi:hypothetical protein